MEVNAMFDFLLNDEQRKIRDEARALVKSIPRQMILDMDSDKLTFPTEFLKEAGKRNLMGCRYPKKWGGRGLDWVATVTVVEEVAKLGHIFGCTFGIGGELVCDAIILHGTDDQKEAYVKPLLAGEIFAAECLTEPRGGSDFFGTTTKAEDKGDYFLVNGQKRFIVGADMADYFLVYAKTDFEKDAHPHKSLTALIVDRGEGVNVEYIYGLMGSRGGGAARVVFKDVTVPKKNVIGKINGAYDIFNTMMIPERLGSAAMALGAAVPALEVATGYTTRRKAFGTTINNFQGVNFQVAEAATQIDAARSIIYTTAKAVDSGMPAKQTRRIVSEAKKFTTEAVQKAVHHAMQVMGGIGYTNIFPVERISRDLRLSSIWTGSNEVMSMIIAHEWYKEYAAGKQSGATRDLENDAAEADAPDEKIYG